ncbi:formylglycine-generating enzyme family protein [Sedimentisphaera salicampi]|uniref:formylglycine-generating enzyme family protein n=1 Tax=Sedimentisphaera salicampi TaxID=1941349 RepID=UPI000B9AA3EC|nr:SUMF1/EgtB/PvdO family nonheme iron enzyme [Sedimentisphaera salicampi]OXU15478.1 hypothetical protein SMSP1_00959 [Sedimentisphaera salicampi]
MRFFLAIGFCLCFISGIIWADTFGTGSDQFDMDFVTISGESNPNSGYGIVDGDYRMGKFEITNDQWNKFVNINGAPTGDPSDAYDQNGGWSGANVPTNEVSWHEAAQFVNWLNTSKGYHAAYKFTGTKGQSDYALDTWSTAEADNGTNLYRHKDAFYYLPTHDEWIKAAYWNGTERQTYATKPGESLHLGNGQSGSGWNYTVNYPQDPPPPGPWDVGSGSEELNGTFDMMGNVAEWIETSEFLSSDYGVQTNRLLRGGSHLSFYGQNFDYDGDNNITNTYPSNEQDYIGFRVASEPEPAISLAADLNEDGLVNVEDLAIFSSQWLLTEN